jgi:hypothetical protein
MRNFSGERRRENQNTNFMFNNFFFFFNVFALLANVEKYYRAGQDSDDNIANAQCMLDTKGYKHTHLECVILIDFPLQQWLHESVSMLRCTYTACPVIPYF